MINPFVSGWTLVDPGAFLARYMFGGGDDYFLTENESRSLMEAASGIAEELDNIAKIALDRARRLSCREGQERKTVSGRLVTPPFSGTAIGQGRWRVILQQFSYSGLAGCDIHKQCCCCSDSPPSGADRPGSYAVRAHCVVHFSIRDLYDFHAWTLRWIPGTPYRIEGAATADVSAGKNGLCCNGAGRQGFSASFR